MKQGIWRLGVLALFLISVQPVSASSPVIVGEISGVEICIQSACGAAVFTGTCDCRVDNRATPGFFWVSVQHDLLPGPSQSSAISDGNWRLTTLRGSFSGKVIEGTIVNNGNNTFNVTATLRLQKRGAVDIFVTGVLDHNDFPPTFEGELIQP